LRYVQRKGINISSVTPLAKLTREFIELEALEQARKFNESRRSARSKLY
jgi:hypothetical protein